MASAYVKSNVATNAGGSTTSISLASVGAGNLLVVSCSFWHGASLFNTQISSISSSPSLTWQRAAGNQGITTDGTDKNSIDVWYAMNSTAGSYSLTITQNGSADCNACLAEFSGVATSGALDNGTTSSGGTSGAGSTPSVGPTATTAQAAELVIACFSANSGTVTNMGLTTPSGFTNIARDQDAKTVAGRSMDYKTVSATGTQSATWGSVPANTFWSTAIATFKDAAATYNDTVPVMSRASAAAAVSAAGVLTEVAADTVRIVDGLVLYEPVGATNSVRNPRAIGAVVSGAMPTNWATSNCTVAAVGTEDGIPYVDLAMSWTGTTPFAFEFDTTYATATSGDVFASSIYAKLVSGSLSGVLLQINVYYTPSGTQFSTAFTPTGAALGTQRVSITGTAPGSTAQVRCRMRFTGAAGTNTFTLRLALPQLERDQLSSPVLPPAGTSALSTRAAEVPNLNFTADTSTVLATLAPSAALSATATGNDSSTVLATLAPAAALSATATDVQPTYTYTPAGSNSYSDTVTSTHAAGDTVSVLATLVPAAALSATSGDAVSGIKTTAGAVTLTAASGDSASTDTQTYASSSDFFAGDYAA